jgi:dephospho-CoA kinase
LVFVGLTGGIGSGKSEALAAGARLGAATLSSDQVVHDLLGTEEVRELLRERWGAGVVEDGEIDRGAVAEVVFANPDELAWLESVIFPRVGEHLAEWRATLEQRSNPPAVAIVEVPLLFEASVEDAFDATVSVVSDEALRAERAGGRDHRGIEGRQARQLSQEEKAARADHVVRNDGSLEDLEREMRSLLRTLSRGTLG